MFLSFTSHVVNGGHSFSETEVQGAGQVREERVGFSFSFLTNVWGVWGTPKWSCVASSRTDIFGDEEIWKALTCWNVGFIHLFIHVCI